MLESTNKPNIDIREYWQIVWRRKFFVIIPFILSLIVGLIIGLITKPVYQSSTVVQIGQGQLLSNAMRGLIPGVTEKERLDNLKRLITSYDYLKRLIQTLNLYTQPEALEEYEKRKDHYPTFSKDEVIELIWIDRLRRFLEIRQLGPDVIQVSAYAYNSDLAYNYAQTLTQIFIDESLRREVGGIRGALEFSAEQLTLYKKKLDDSEEQLRKFKEGLVQDQLESYSVISGNLEQVNSMLTATEFELKEAKDKLNFLIVQTQASGINYPSVNNFELNALKARFLEAILELSKLMLKYSWQDVKVLTVNQEIEKLRSDIRMAIENEIKSHYSNSQNKFVDIIAQKEIVAMEIDFLEQRRNAYSKLIRFYEENVTKGPSRELTLNRLEREVAANREIYQMLLQQTRGSEIEEALQKTTAELKFKIIEPAIKPIKPIKPDRLRIIVMAMALGIGVGAGLIFFLEYTDHSFKKVEVVEQFLNLPVLGIIPQIELDVSNKPWGK